MNRVSQFSSRIQERRGKQKVPPRITRRPQNRLTRFQTANYPVASFLATYSKRIIERQIAASSSTIFVGNRGADAWTRTSS